jgi:hypothetical protein
VGGSQPFPNRLRLIAAAAASGCGLAEDEPICNFLSTNGDLRMEIVFLLYGTKSECRVVGETEEEALMESASGAGAKVLENLGQTFGVEGSDGSRNSILRRRGVPSS